MAHLQFKDYNGVGELHKEKYYYSQAVRVGDIIETAGQGGWDRDSGVISSDLATEIKQAFDNVDHNIKNAGGKGWSEVYKVTSYHVKLSSDTLGLFVDNMRAFCPDHAPCWTAIGVDRLGRDDMRIEIDVAAHSPK